jgi:transposase-like protein
MNIDHLRKRFSDETVCRQFFESVIWKDGPLYPHCGHATSCRLHGALLRVGVYECYRCKRQFTVTTKTPLHSTKLPLWKWMQAMYYIVNSSKAISSVALVRLLGVTQPTAWKLGHCIRAMMD